MLFSSLFAKTAEYEKLAHALSAPGACALFGLPGSGRAMVYAALAKETGRFLCIVTPGEAEATRFAGDLNALGIPTAVFPARDYVLRPIEGTAREYEYRRLSVLGDIVGGRLQAVCVPDEGLTQYTTPRAEFCNNTRTLHPGDTVPRTELTALLYNAGYARRAQVDGPGQFSIRGDIVDLYAPDMKLPVRMEFWGDEIELIAEVDKVTGEVITEFEALPVWPATHYVASRPAIERALDTIRTELQQRLEEFNKEGKLLEAQRLEMRTTYDLEMIETMGFCSGIENYSRHLDGRAPGVPPYTLIDYFPEDFVCFIDESHVTVPQVRGMYEGDRSRKTTLAEHGFRLPSCLDNRPLRFDEFEERIPQFIYTSATPGDYEERVSESVVEQIIRPTGLLDPKITVKPIKSQIDDIIDEAKIRVEKKERVLITTLTKRMAEDLTEYLLDQGVKARYMHSDIGTIERVEILRDLRLGEFDVLVGINLLREGLDLPEVSLVAILDADKEGFLRNHRSLIQTIGRAARNAEGEVIMYADVMTDSMSRAIKETERRRSLQIAFNEEHGIVPTTIRKGINDITDQLGGDDERSAEEVNRELANLSRGEVMRVISDMENEMIAASQAMDFEKAATLRDEIVSLRIQLEGKSETDVMGELKKTARKGSAYGRRKR